jgi:hypothetical protein
LVARLIFLVGLKQRDGDSVGIKVRAFVRVERFPNAINVYRDTLSGIAL